MTRRLAPPPAAAPVCRWCGQAHRIVDCPKVKVAFGKDTPINEKPCVECGRTVRTRGTSNRVFCAECRELQAERRNADVRQRCAYSRGGNIRPDKAGIVVVQSADFVAGSGLRGWETALAEGCLEPGMIVRRHGRLMRVHGPEGHRQTLVLCPRGEAQQNSQ